MVKLGTSSCLEESGRIRGEVILPLAREIQQLRERGAQVVLVSSGAVGMGRRTAWGRRIDPRELSSKQALASLGQVELMNVWRSVFELLGIGVGQVLLTRGELERRERYLNARNTLSTLLAAGVLPVVNENDSVATDEIRFGDNDILAALVGSLIEAEVVINLTRAEGLLDFRTGVGGCALIEEVRSVDDRLFELVNQEISEGGTGGMASKLHAAREAARYGAAMVIANSQRPSVLTDILAGEVVGTLFWPASDPLRGRRRWLASSTLTAGTVTVDEGATKALVERGSSLLAVGVQALEGNFRIGDIVEIVGSRGRSVGRGLIDRSRDELDQLLAGQAGATTGQVVIHRNNLFLYEPRD